MSEPIPKKVLIVDDDADFAESLGTFLRGQGLAAEIATSGEEGLEKARSAPPALIIMDIMMPGIHGLQAIRDLKEDPRTADIPVMVFSGVSRDPIEFEAADLGAEFFQKTVDPKTLAQKIQRRLSRLDED